MAEVKTQREANKNGGRRITESDEKLGADTAAAVKWFGFILVHIA